MGKSVSIQFVRTLFVIAVGLVLPPMMNHYLSTDDYGGWEVIVSLMGLLQLIAMGIPMASVKHLSKAAAQEDHQKVRQTLATCTGLYLGVGVIALLVGLSLIPFFEVLCGEKVRALSDGRLGDAKVALTILAFNTALSFAARFPQGILVSYHHFVPFNLMLMASTAARVLLIYLVLSSTAQYAHLALAEGLIILVDFVLPMTFIWKRIPQARFQRSDFDRTVMNELLWYGGFVLLLQMGIRLSMTLDGLVIGSAMNLENVNYYSRSNTFLIYLTELMVSLAAVVMPTASKLDGQGRLDEARPLLLKWSKIAMSLSFLVCLYLLAFGPEFIGLWMGEEEFVDPARSVLPILVASCLAFLPVRAVALPLLMGIGQVKKPALLFLGAGLLNLGISVVLVRTMGLPGVALGTAIPNTLFAGTMVYAASRSIGLDPMEWVKYVFGKALIGGALALAGMMALRRWIHVDSIPTFLLSGILCTLIFGLIWVFFVHRNDPYVDLLATARKKLRR